jgi:hypothetical protein
MLHQLGKSVPVIRVFLQADQDEILGLFRYLCRFGELDLVFDLG